MTTFFPPSMVALCMTVVGIILLGMWLFFLLTHQIPELQKRRKETALHLLAEFVTAILLIFSSIGQFLGYPWAPTLSLLTIGMLLYSIINSGLGYYIQKENLILIIMFMILTLFTITIAVLNFFL